MSIDMVSSQGDTKLVYYTRGGCTKVILSAELDAGYVLTDLVRGGPRFKNDVGYYRKGTPEEIAHARKLMADAARSDTGSAT